MSKIYLNTQEIGSLDAQDPATAHDGGYQKFLVSLQSRLDRTDGSIVLNDGDRERIPRYAFSYGNGGWENRLKAIFMRNLGPELTGI